MISVPVFTVDAFSSRPFSGNPASVCLVSAPVTARWMQAVAAEMNHSETAFLTPREDGFSLRWFTPACEVDLCGHATLASAHVLFEKGALPAEAVARFHTRSGWLGAWRKGNEVVLDFPALPVSPCPAPAGLAQALGVKPLLVARNRFDYLVEVGSEKEVCACRPDLRALAGLTARGVMVTARSARREADFASRYFAPAAGIDEDPVTGSAHCALGPFWQATLGKARLRGVQLSARGGEVGVEPRGERVLLSGRAVTVLRGMLQA